MTTTAQSFARAARKIERAAGAVGTRLPSGYRVIAEEVMTDVKAAVPGKGVPVDEGILRGTGKVTGPTRGVVTLGFGGPAAPYALRQHEELDWHHSVGEARYLVRGLERWRPGGQGSVRALRRNAERGLEAAARS